MIVQLRSDFDEVRSDLLSKAGREWPNMTQRKLLSDYYKSTRMFYQFCPPLLKKNYDKTKRKHQNENPNLVVLILVQLIWHFISTIFFLISLPFIHVAWQIQMHLHQMKLMQNCCYRDKIYVDINYQQSIQQIWSFCPTSLLMFIH